VIVATINEEIVGNAGLLRHRGRRSHAADVMMGIDDGHVGKGIGTALMTELIEIADNWLDLKRLELTVYVDNAAAIHLYEKFGFVSEGIHVKDAFRDGEFVDSLAMARLNFYFTLRKLSHRHDGCPVSGTFIVSTASPAFYRDIRPVAILAPA